MKMEFGKWLKELARNRRHLVINSGWGSPERELKFFTKTEVEQKWDSELSKEDGVLIDTVNLYNDSNITCSLFPWNYIIAEVAGPAQGNSMRRAFISNRTLLVHYITTGTMEFYGRDKTLDKSIFPEGIHPLNDTVVFIPRWSYNNIVEDGKKTFGVEVE